MAFKPRLELYAIALAVVIVSSLLFPYLLHKYARVSMYFFTPFQSIVSEILKGIWLLYLLFLVPTVYGILTYMGNEFHRVPDRVFLEGAKVIFQIASRGFNQSALSSSVESVFRWAGKYIKDYEVWLVVEESARSGFFEELARRYEGRLRVLYVPKEYVTEKGTLYKARALNYALETSVKEGLVGENIWVFLDG